jgi:predicted RNA-binding Zn-ribbon protein involved in translation (DUF1610 family)
MARTKVKMFGCPACGYRVSSGDEVCPRCGNAFDKETKFECPFCGEMVERGAMSCQACHVDYAEFREKTEARGGDDSIDLLLLDIIKLESTSVKQGDKRFSCPKCDWMLDGSEEKCPKCRESLSGDTSFQCPICGAPVNPDSAKCPECGTGFSQDEEARAYQHVGAEHSLDEITAAAAQMPSPSEGLESTKAEEDVQSRWRGKDDFSSVTDRISSTFGKITEAMKVESKPQPTQSPPREEKPVVEIAAEPEPTTPAPSADLSTEEEAKDAQAEPEPATPKKTKTRKLKAKPQGAKPK